MEKDCGMWIHILSHKLKKRMNTRMHTLGLTGVQSRMLHYILVKSAEGPVYQRDVENAFNSSRSTITGILQLMEKNGLITREGVDSDGRLKSLIPTEKAACLDAQVTEYLRRSEQRLVQGLSEDQIRQFLKMAEHMSANLDS